MATVVVQQQPPLRHSVTPPPLTPALTLSTAVTSTAVPNKHIPFCPPGPTPSPNQADTPPNSPPSRSLLPKATSLLYPPTSFKKLCTSPPIYGISADSLNEVLEQQAAQPMLEPSHVFPWMHGLHPDNHIQLAFFVARRKALRKIPKLLRGITILKAGGDLSRARLRGAIAPDEVLSLCDDNGAGFLECDPREGFSVRNFHIQTAKMAQTSDIVVYGDDKTDMRIIKSVAERTASVQRKWKKTLENAGQCPETFNTFVLTDSFKTIEQTYPELVVIDSKGKLTEHAMDFLQWERNEMCEMSKASEISQGVYLGPSPGISTIPSRTEESGFDVLVEASDHATMPDQEVLDAKTAQLGDDTVHIAFPSSGSILPSSWSQSEINGILMMCRWLYNLTHPSKPIERATDQDGDIQMADLAPRPRRILIHCADGYTESTLLGVAYFMYAEGLPIHEAWIRLHRDKGRNFFAYPSDVALLTAMQERILTDSPACDQATKREAMKAPAWLTKLDGSLPSRVTPYMYLGNLTHANNPQMLKELGIKRILSIGEPVSWSDKEKEAWGRQNLRFVDRVQDNGIDELRAELESPQGSLAYIGMRISRNR